MTAMSNDNIFVYVSGIGEVLDTCPEYFEQDGVYAGREGAIILAKQLGGILAQAKAGRDSIRIAKSTYSGWFRKYYSIPLLTKKEWTVAVLEQVLSGEEVEI